MIDEHFYPKTIKSTCKTRLTRIYFSKNIRVFYLLLVIVCALDLIAACIYLDKYHNKRWILSIDLALNFIVILDSVLRIYARDCKSLADIRSLWAEILSISLSLPDIVLTFFYIYALKRINYTLEFTSIILTAVIILIRPIIIFRFHQKSRIDNVTLPMSVATGSAIVTCTRGQRIDTQYTGEFDSAVKELPTPY